MSENEPNVSFNINGNVNQAAAKIVNQNTHVGDVNNYAGGPPTVDQVFDKVAEAVATLPETDREQFETQVVEPLRELAKQPREKQQEPSTMEKAQQLISRITPIAGPVSKAVMAFGEGALTALASQNPVVRGTLAAIGTLKTVEGGADSQLA